MRHLALFLLALPLVFSITGMVCDDFEEMCLESACKQAGGFTEGTVPCSPNEEFDNALYANMTLECARLKQQCIETDGFLVPPRNMTCCGPMLVLLAALAFSSHIK